jgi:hypothetical protein
MPLTHSLLLWQVCAEPIMTLDIHSLVAALPDDLQLPNLPQRMAALLQQSENHLALVQSSVECAEADIVALMRERHRLAQRGTLVQLTPDGAPAGAK